MPDAASMSARTPRSSCHLPPDVPCDAPPRRDREGFGSYWARLHLMQGAEKSQQQLRCEYKRLNADARQNFEDYIVAQEQGLSQSTEAPGGPDLTSTPLKKRKLDEPGSSSPPDVLMPCTELQLTPRAASDLAQSCRKSPRLPTGFPDADIWELSAPQLSNQQGVEGRACVAESHGLCGSSSGALGPTSPLFLQAGQRAAEGESLAAARTQIRAVYEHVLRKSALPKRHADAAVSPDQANPKICNVFAFRPLDVSFAGVSWHSMNDLRVLSLFFPIFMQVPTDRVYRQFVGKRAMCLRCQMSCGRIRTKSVH